MEVGELFKEDDIDEVQQRNYTDAEKFKVTVGFEVIPRQRIRLLCD